MASSSLVVVMLALLAVVCVWSTAVDGRSAPADYSASAAAGDSSPQDGLQADGDVELAKDLQWLKERTAQLAAVAEKLKSAMALKSSDVQSRRASLPLGARTVNKRHCWDVADVCCMWNIC